MRGQPLCDRRTLLGLVRNMARVQCAEALEKAGLPELPSWLPEDKQMMEEYLAERSRVCASLRLAKVKRAMNKAHRIEVLAYEIASLIIKSGDIIDPDKMDTEAWLKKAIRMLT